MRIFLFVFFFLFVLTRATAQSSDNGDGTFTNPVIWGDFPDPDVVRVGNKYYMVSTSMQYSPGVQIMVSEDLVNWRFLSFVIDRFDFHPAYDLQGEKRYAKGQWATCIKYHQGTYFVLFTTLTEGSFLCTTTDPASKWNVEKLPGFYYDPGLFFDQDEKVYVIHGNTKIQVTPLSKDARGEAGPTKVVFQASYPGLEGSHCYHIGDYYYIFCTYGGPRANQVCLRSKSIFGPYEQKVVMEDDLNLSGFGIHQGCLIQTPDNGFWSIIFQDRGSVGRVPYLFPVSWEHHWPIIGRQGKGIATLKKPLNTSEKPAVQLPTSDDFASSKLGPQWQWNHNPDNQKWSLSERKGFLRLYTSGRGKTLIEARNSLTQRIFGPVSVATAKNDITHMQNGDNAGLAIFQKPSAYVGIKQQGGKKTLVMVNQDSLVAQLPLANNSTVFLRTVARVNTDQAAFYFSYDDKVYHKIGNELQMKFSLDIFTGNRVMLFNFSQTGKGNGYIDVDWLNIDLRKSPPSQNHAGVRIEAEYFDDKCAATAERRQDPDDDGGHQMLLTGEASSLTFNRVVFTAAAKTAYLRLRAFYGGSIQLRADSASGNILGELRLDPDKNFQTVQVPVELLGGTRKLVLVNNSRKPLLVNWMTFNKTSVNKINFPKKLDRIVPQSLF